MKHIEKINYCFVFCIKIIILRPIFDKFWIMIKFMSGLALAAASLLMASCCSQPDIDGKWNIVKVNGEEVTVAGDEKPFIEFNAEESKVHGFTGCNIMNGPYTLDGKELTFGNMATTMMAGPEENMKTESSVLGAMQDVASVDMSGETLKLLDSEKNIIMELEK